jgi:hypothetical protein
LYSSIAANPLGIIAESQLGGNDIYINPGGIAPADYYGNLSVVLHGLLHNTTGLTDFDLQGGVG